MQISLELSPIQQHILLHATGQGEGRRNRYCAAPNDDLQALVDAGLFECRNNFDSDTGTASYFATPIGLREASQLRWELEHARGNRLFWGRWRDEDGREPFWLKNRHGVVNSYVQHIRDYWGLTYRKALEKCKLDGLRVRAGTQESWLNYCERRSKE